ncbi:pseudouridine synthase family protein isoform X3 [Wolffia australiana]
MLRSLGRRRQAGAVRPAAAWRRSFSRISPPPPTPATVLRVSKNNIAFLGPPKEGPKPRQLLSLPPFPPHDVNPLPGRKNSQPSRVTAITWTKHYFSDVPPPVIQTHFNQGLVSSTAMIPSSLVGIKVFFGGFVRSFKVRHDEAMKPGMQLYLPVSVAETKISRRYDTIPTATLNPNADEIAYLRRLVTHKDSAIIVLNKPPKMPVKGRLPVHNAMDALMAAALSHGKEEGPKLVHRLDAESSGLLLLSRTKESAAWLHTLFFTVPNSGSCSEMWSRRSTMQRYWALVIGRPAEREGVIRAPLSKVLLNGGKTERVILAHPSGIDGWREATTEYRVMGPTIRGCSWLELRPLTRLKHQLRVHCAEALGTPIVGDFKYGWCAHRRWQQTAQPDYEPRSGQPYRLRRPHGLPVQKGSVLSNVPLLHLHCRELVLPDVAAALRRPTGGAAAPLLRFVAPLHPHMQLSWNVMSSFLV